MSAPRSHRLDNVAKFFVAASKPHPLAKAPGGERYLQDSDATVARGQQMFAENCAACHVSYNKMPQPPPGVERETKAWDDWTRSADFKSKMTALVRDPDFLNDNYPVHRPPLSGQPNRQQCLRRAGEQCHARTRLG